MNKRAEFLSHCLQCSQCWGVTRNFLSMVSDDVRNETYSQAKGVGYITRGCEFRRCEF